MTLQPVASVEEMLCRLGTDFGDFVDAFVRGRYAFWLGSGISKFRMPDVWVLLERVVDFLRVRSNDEGGTGPHSAALTEVLVLAGLDENQRSEIDLSHPARLWKRWDVIAQVLCEKYDEVLNIPVGSEPEDYLVWTGLDVPGTYGDDTVEPDVEHLCIALLMLEGVVSTAVTANWDGLIEKAIASLVDEPDDVVRVIVKPIDFREKNAPRELIKFHGCAVRALEDEEQYRPLLIARQPQIDGWSEKDEHKHVRSQLEARFSDHETLMLGLSAQDANMHTMFHKASLNLKRTWKPAWPAVVLSEQSLRSYHRGVLEATYSNYGPSNRDDIANGAVLGAWAKPVLVALLLWTLTEKAVELVAKVDMPGLSKDERAKLDASLRVLRDRAGAEAAGGTLAFVEALVGAVSTVISTFRSGRPTSMGGLYEPVSGVPVGKAASSNYFPTEQLGRLGIVISLLARGDAENAWVARTAPPASVANGAILLEAADKSLRLFVVKDEEAWQQLATSDGYDETDPDIIVVHAGSAPRKSKRSPRSRKRTGHVGAAHLVMAAVCGDAECADDLFDEFKQAGGFA